MPVAAVLGAAAVGAAGTAYASNKQSKASDRAVTAQTQAADQAAQVQREQLNYAQSLNAPYQHIGTQALNVMGREFGLSPYGSQPRAQGGTQGGAQYGSQFSPEYRNAAMEAFGSEMPQYNPAYYESAGATPGAMPYQGQMMGSAPVATQGQGSAPEQGFFTSPGYQFRQEQGQKAIENALIARGRGLSGQQVKAATEYNQGLASEEYGNWYNRLAGLAGIGQSANQSALGYGGTASRGVSNAIMGGGNAAAQGAINQGNIAGNFAQNISGIAGSTLGNVSFMNQMNPQAGSYGTSWNRTTGFWDAPSMVS